MAFRQDSFKGSLACDRFNGGKLAKFSQYTVEQSAAPSLIILMSLDVDLIADFNCEDYYDFGAVDVNNIWQQARQWSHCVSYFDNFLVESQPGFLFLEDLPETSIGFRDWLASLTPTTIEHGDGYSIKGRNSILESQYYSDFSSFCKRFERLQVDAGSKPKPFSYRDAVLKSSPLPSPSASNPSPVSTFTTITSSAQSRKWTPQFTVVKAPFKKIDKEYGNNNEPMLDDDEYSDLIDNALRVKYQTGVTRYRAITRLPPKILEKKQERILSKGAA